MPGKTHVYFNHSPITKLVIEQILDLPAYAVHKPRSLVISTRGQRVDAPGVEELRFDDERLAQDLDYAQAFFHAAPDYAFESLTVFLPQTRYALGHFLIHSPLVETLHYIEEGVGTMAFGRLQTRWESSRRNTRGKFGVIDNSWLGRSYKVLTRAPKSLGQDPSWVRDLPGLLRFHGTQVHFMWRPTWHRRVGKVFAFHDVWPERDQVVLPFPVPKTRHPSGATALLLLPPVYRSANGPRFEARVRALFEGLAPGLEIWVKCHPSDTHGRWLELCQALYPGVREVDDPMQEPALTCYANQIPLCLHFNSSSKEYFKFLPWDEELAPPGVIDLWPASLGLAQLLAMDPASRPSSDFEYPLPAKSRA